jgi:hypothetical protein
MSLVFLLIIVILASLIISIIIYISTYLLRGDFAIHKKINQFLKELDSNSLWLKRIDKQYEKFGMGERIMYFIMNCKETKYFIESNFIDNNINHLKLKILLYERLKKAFYEEHRERISN